MGLLEDLVELERGFWNATGDPEYYREHMADEGLAVFSIGVMGKDAAIASTSNAGMSEWTDIEISEPRLLELTPESAALVYQGSAKRDGEPYSANSASVYVKRNGRWQMALHQQSET
jgi:hypothetical protein